MVSFANFFHRFKRLHSLRSLLWRSVQLASGLFLLEFVIRASSIPIGRPRIDLFTLMIIIIAGVSRVSSINSEFTIEFLAHGCQSAIMPFDVTLMFFSNSEAGVVSKQFYDSSMAGSRGYFCLRSLTFPIN